MIAIKDINDIRLDDGYRLGLGVFETIAVKKGKGIFLSYHMERLKEGLETLDIPIPTALEEKVNEQIGQMPVDRDVLRVTVSQENILLETRKNPYTEEQYAKGFSIMYSSVRRNETSPMTRIKSLNQGDNVLQRRLALKRGFNEAIFLNSKGELTEGTVSNLFFVLDNQLYTPAASCGLLPGTVRRWLLEEYKAKEIHILSNDVKEFQEMFITNALLGIMPVHCLGSYTFPERKVTGELLEYYKKLTG